VAGVAATHRDWNDSHALRGLGPLATAARPANPAKPGLSLFQRAQLVARRALAKARGKDARAAIYPPSPFADWDYEAAEQAIEDALDAQTIDTSRANQQAIVPAQGEAIFIAPRSRQNPIAINRAFYQGDHWQRGSGYIGPHPQSTDRAFNDTMVEIANIFTSQNAIGEVTTRHTLGVVGKPFRWSFVPRRDTGDQKPTTAEQAAIEEVTALVRTWMLARKVPTLVRNATSTLLLDERSAFRLTIPAGLTKTNAAGETEVEAASVEEALAKIWPEHPTPEESAVISDADTKLEAGVVVYEGAAEVAAEVAEGTTDDDDETEDYAWLCFLNEVGDTVIRIIGESDDSASDTSAAGETDDSDDDASEDAEPGTSTLKLGGRLTMFEMHRPALITPQVQQGQRALNFALTMVPRNVTTGGFVERLLMDAQAPGEPEVVDGKRTGRWIEKPFYTGAGTTNFVEGAEYEEIQPDGTRTIRRGSPSAIFRDPVKPDASLTAKDAHYRSILSEVGQLHVLISGDATSSAVARIQARAEYLNTLLLTQPEVEAALCWLLETAIAMAEAIAKTPGKYTNLLRAEVNCKLDTGPITPEERKAIEESIGVTISQETAMLMLGIEDVDAEKSRMADDPNSRIKSGEALGKALLSLTMAGATLEGAAKLLKLEQKEIDDLMTPETFEATPAGVRLNQPKPGKPGETPPPAPPPIPSVPGDKPGTAPTPAPSKPAAASPETKPASSSGSAPGGQGQ
jgi:hypothetical protein